MNQGRARLAWTDGWTIFVVEEMGKVVENKY